MRIYQDGALVATAEVEDRQTAVAVTLWGAEQEMPPAAVAVALRRVRETMRTTDDVVQALERAGFRVEVA